MSSRSTSNRLSLVTISNVRDVWKIKKKTTNSFTKPQQLWEMPSVCVMGALPECCHFLIRPLFDVLLLMLVASEPTRK